MRRVAIIVIILAAAAGISAFRVTSNDEGAELAARYCQSCHVQPTPDMLDKKTWVAKVFPMMRRYMGMDPIPRRDVLPHDLQAFYPTFPAMTEDEWFTVAQWYIDAAPQTLPAPSAINDLGVSPLFRPVAITHRTEMPMTTFVAYDSAHSSIVLGDAMANALHLASTAGRITRTIPLGGPPSSVVIGRDAWYVTDMGKLLPHDSAVGKLHRIIWRDSVPTSTVVLDSLRRPTHLVVTDLNGDRRDDFLVCEYGNLIGRFGWYEIDASGRTRYHELSSQPGALRAAVRDMNGDKRPDIVVQMAQAREGLVVYINKGKGRFEQRELLTFPPCYGSSSFTFADVDGDGTDEIVMTAGDNGDYDEPPYKPYHGVRVFARDRKGAWEERSFQHMDGAYGALVRDFDLDGTRDMLSFSYFPRFDRGIVDLVRLDAGVFTPNQRTWQVSGAELGRWLVSDVADIDRDGDLDVILGNVSMGPGIVPESVAQSWMSGGVMAMILVNTTR